MLKLPSERRTISSLVKPCRWIALALTRRRTVQRQGPKPRRRRHAGEHDVAAAVERAAVIVRSCDERHAVAEGERQLAGARDRCAGVRVGVGGAGFRKGGPAADAQRAEGGAAVEREIGRAEPDRGGDEQRRTVFRSAGARQGFRGEGTRAIVAYSSAKSASEAGACCAPVIAGLVQSMRLPMRERSPWQLAWVPGQPRMTQLTG